MAIVETVWNGATSMLYSGEGTKTARVYVGSQSDLSKPGYGSARGTNPKINCSAIVGPIGNGAVVTVNAQVRVASDGVSGAIVTKATGVKN